MLLSLRSELPPVIEVKTERVFAIDSSHPPFLQRMLMAVPWYGRFGFRSDHARPRECLKDRGIASEMWIMETRRMNIADTVSPNPRQVSLQRKRP